MLVESRMLRQTGLAALSILDGEIHHITVAGRRLLIPLTETLPDPESDGVCSVKTVTKPSNIGESHFLILLNETGSMIIPQRRLKMKEGKQYSSSSKTNYIDIH